MHKRSSENEIVVLEKLAIRIFRRPSIASLKTIPAAAVAWASPTKIRIFCPSPKNRIDQHIFRGQSPRYFSTRYQGRLKTPNRSHRIKPRFSDDLYSF